MNAFSSGLFPGVVMHRRVKPKRHKLTYDVYSLLLDLDELPALDRAITGFGYNRAAPMSFRDRDHGPGTDQPLKPWVEQQLRAAGLEPDGGPVRLLCYPRIFGFVFNPITVYFCYRKSGTLIATVYEVHNTFRQRHFYVIPVKDGETDVIAQACEKKMYVSPFIEMAMTYHFRVKPPADEVAISIEERDAEGALLYASFHGNRHPLTSRAVLRSLIVFPFLTMKVIAGIHWEALKIWLKGIRVVDRPDPPQDPVTLVKI